MSELKKVKNYSDDILNLCKKKVKGATDVSGSCGWKTSVVFEEGSLKTIKSAQTSSLALRIIHKGKLGVSGTYKIDQTEINEVLQDAIKVSRYGKKADFVLPRPQKRKKTNNSQKPYLYDNSIAKIKENNLVKIGEKIIEKIKTEESGMKVRSLTFNHGWAESIFLNTQGIKSKQKTSLLSIGLETAKIREGDFFQLYTGQTSRKKDIKYLHLVDNLLEKARWGRKRVKIKPGKYPVIFAPESTSTILSYFLTNLNGKFVNEESSKFVSKLGKKLFDSRLSLIDDPTLDYYPSSYLFDDEGVLGKRKYLIKDGVINSFYYDLAQAAKANVKATGNGSREGIFSQARPAVSNIIVSGGDKKYSKLIKEIKEGILAYGFLGAGQDNPYNGDFQLNLYIGFKIEYGKIVGRLKNTALAGNVFELLENDLVWLSKETERWGSIETPFICLNNVSVTVK